MKRNKKEAPLVRLARQTRSANSQGKLARQTRSAIKPSVIEFAERVCRASLPSLKNRAETIFIPKQSRHTLPTS